MNSGRRYVEIRDKKIVEELELRKAVRDGIGSTSPTFILGRP
jgi:hypothetical protein